MTQSVIKGRLSAAVAVAGTFTAGYPSGKDGGNFYLAMGHTMMMGQAKLVFPYQFDITINSTNVTVTNKTAAAWPINTDFVLGLQERGERQYASVPETFPNQYTQPLSVARTADRQNLVASTTRAPVVDITLGKPLALSAAGIAAITLFAAAGAFVLTSTPFTMDVPRNVTLTVATTDQSARTVTIIGTDVYGNAMRENITGPNNNTVQGKKAFKTVTSATVDGAVATNGISIGWGNILGLPVFLPSVGYILKEMQDGAAATAGTVVAGIRLAAGSTATSGDVRGTYLPNAAPDAAKVYVLLVSLPDPGYLGMAQFNG